MSLCPGGRQTEKKPPAPVKEPALEPWPRPRWLLTAAFYLCSALLALFCFGVAMNLNKPADEGMIHFATYVWFSWLICLAGLNRGRGQR